MENTYGLLTRQTTWMMATVAIFSAFANALPAPQESSILNPVASPTLTPTAQSAAVSQASSSSIAHAFVGGNNHNNGQGGNANGNTTDGSTQTDEDFNTDGFTDDGSDFGVLGAEDDDNSGSEGTPSGVQSNGGTSTASSSPEVTTRRRPRPSNLKRPDDIAFSTEIVHTTVYVENTVVSTVAVVTGIRVVVPTTVVVNNQIVTTTVIYNTPVDEPLYTQGETQIATALVPVITPSVSYAVSSFTVSGDNAETPSIVMTTVAATTIPVTAAAMMTQVVVHVSGSGAVTHYVENGTTLTAAPTGPISWSSSPTPSPTSTSLPSSSTSKTLNAGSIIGIITGALALIALCIFFVYRRRWRSRQVSDEARNVNPFMSEAELMSADRNNRLMRESRPFSYTLANHGAQPFINTNENPFLDPFTADPPPVSEDGYARDYGQATSIPFLLRTPIARSPKDDSSAFPAAGRLSSYPRSSTRSHSQPRRERSRQGGEQSGSQGRDSGGTSSRQHSRAGSSAESHGEHHDRSATAQERERAMSDADMDRLVRLIASRSNMKDDPFSSPSDKLPPDYSDDGADMDVGRQGRRSRRAERDGAREMDERPGEGHQVPSGQPHLRQHQLTLSDSQNHSPGASLQHPDDR